MHNRAILVALAILTVICPHAHCAARLGDERIVFQTKFGDLELALYPEVSSSYLHWRAL